MGIIRSHFHHPFWCKRWHSVSPTEFHSNLIVHKTRSNANFHTVLYMPNSSSILQTQKLLIKSGEIDPWRQFHQTWTHRVKCKSAEVQLHNKWVNFFFYWRLDCLFALLGSAIVKALHKHMLMKLTPDWLEYRLCEPVIGKNFA